MARCVQNAQYQNSVFLIPYSIIVVAIVYIFCTLVDLLRQQIVEKPFTNVLDRYSERIARPFERMFNIIKNIIFGKAK